jgi:hypothetical protein
MVVTALARMVVGEAANDAPYPAWRVIEYTPASVTTEEAANAIVATVTVGSVIRLTLPPSGADTVIFMYIKPQPLFWLSVAVKDVVEALSVKMFFIRPEMALKLRVIEHA